jgi:hypothetical protein
MSQVKNSVINCQHGVKISRIEGLPELEDPSVFFKRLELMTSEKPL